MKPHLEYFELMILPHLMIRNDIKIEKNAADSAFLYINNNRVLSVHDLDGLSSIYTEKTLCMHDNFEQYKDQLNIELKRIMEGDKL